MEKCFQTLLINPALLCYLNQKRTHTQNCRSISLMNEDEKVLNEILAS